MFRKKAVIPAIQIAPAPNNTHHVKAVKTRLYRNGSMGADMVCQVEPRRSERRPRNQLATTRTATTSQITRTPFPNPGRARYSRTFRVSPLDSLLEETPERGRGCNCTYAGLQSADRAFLLSR